jgi:hypothetical protein
VGVSSGFTNLGFLSAAADNIGRRGYCRRVFVMCVHGGFVGNSFISVEKKTPKMLLKVRGLNLDRARKFSGLNRPREISTVLRNSRKNLGFHALDSGFQNVN